MPTTRLTRRTTLLALGATALVPMAGRADGRILRVAKTATCGCCQAWVDHMTQAGFDVRAGNMEHDALQDLKAQLGIRPEHASCHTAEIDGYIIEGHVPADDVKALLAERPNGLGLSVPGMPIGSPGMEMGATRERFDTLLLGHDGQTSVFRTHN